MDAGRDAQIGVCDMLMAVTVDRDTFETRPHEFGNYIMPQYAVKVVRQGDDVLTTFTADGSQPYSFLRIPAVVAEQLGRALLAACIGQKVKIEWKVDEGVLSATR